MPDLLPPDYMPPSASTAARRCGSSVDRRRVSHLRVVAGRAAARQQLPVGLPPDVVRRRRARRSTCRRKTTRPRTATAGTASAELPAGAPADRARRAVRHGQHVRDGLQRDHLGHPRLGPVQPDQLLPRPRRARCSTTPTARCSRTSTTAGCSQNTMVLAFGEFGRTPKVNPAGGRDHWTNCWTMLMARRRRSRAARSIGASDEIGGVPARPPDRAARDRRHRLQGARHRPRDPAPGRGQPSDPDRRLRPPPDRGAVLTAPDSSSPSALGSAAGRRGAAGHLVPGRGAAGPTAPRSGRRAGHPARARPSSRAGRAPAAAGRASRSTAAYVGDRTPRTRPSPRPTRPSPPWTTRVSSPRSATAARSSLTATAGGRSVSTVIEVERASAPYPLSFRNHVLPVLTKAGCNSGPCHGALAGKNGFKLTLRGYDPEARLPDADAAGAARGASTRSIRRDSLMLLKPTLAVVARRRQAVRAALARVSRARATGSRPARRRRRSRDPGHDRASKCSPRRRGCSRAPSSRWSSAPTSPTATPRTSRAGRSSRPTTARSPTSINAGAGEGARARARRRSRRGT